MNTHRGAEVQLQSVIILGVRWRLKVVIKPGSLHPREEIRCPFIRRSLRPVSYPFQVSKPERKSPYPSSCTDYPIPFQILGQ
jgi:hypothetical protein